MNQIITGIKLSIGVLTAVSVFTFQSPKVDAAVLVPNAPVTDNLRELVIKWDWNPVADGASSSDPVLNNWFVSLKISPAVPPGNGNWVVHLDVKHKTDPHPGETMPELAFKDLTFPDPDNGDNIIDSTLVVPHPGVGHDDVYYFQIDPRQLAMNQPVKISLFGDHDLQCDLAQTVPNPICQQVPEPTSTLSLLALGAFGAASTLKRKLNPENSCPTT